MKVKTAAELCHRLRETFTGDAKLENIRVLLRSNPNATAEEGYQALFKDESVPQTTLDKAKAFIEVGHYYGKTFVVEGKVEDEILGTSPPEPVRADDVESRAKAEAKKAVDDALAEMKAQLAAMKADADAKAEEAAKAKAELEALRAEAEAKKPKK